MKVPESFASLSAPLIALQNLLEQFDGRGMIIGGIAASLIGKPRLTADIDAVLLLSTQRIPELLEVANQVGFEPRIDNAAEFTRRNRVLLLRHLDSGIPVDLSLGILPFEVEAVDRSQVHQIGDILIRLPTPEDLIILKGVASRPRDLEDIQGIISAHPEIDWSHIEYWLKEFTMILDRPEILANVIKFKK